MFKTWDKRTQGTQLIFIAMTQVFGLSVWFSSTAVIPSLVYEWGITESQAAWLSMATQLGFVIGAIGSSLSGVLDRFEPNKILGISAIMAAVLTSVFAIFVNSLVPAVVIRFLLGIFLAGIYPTGLKLTASWSFKNRSRSFGLLGGCLTLGSSLPYLLGAFHGIQWDILVASTALACAGAGLLSLIEIRSGPYLEPPCQVELSYVWTMFKDRKTCASCLGYFGHMFELYAVWTWLPVFMMHSLSQNSLTPELSISVFFCLGVGGFIGCVLGGYAAERFGRAKITMLILIISGLCCLLAPFVYGSGTLVLMLFAFVWGAAVIADSGLFSAMLSSAANRHAVGTALSVQTAVGFLITLITIQATPMLALNYGWQFAFPYLAFGPLLGIVVIRRLQPWKRSSELGTL